MGDGTPPGTIRVVGEATVTAKPDMAELDLGVVSEAKTAEAAAAENAKKMDRVMAALKKELGEGGEVKTVGYLVTQRFGETKPNDPKPVIVAYVVTNIVRARIPEVKSAGRIVDLALKQGANEVQRLIFTLKNPEPVQAEALKAAAAKARARATALAAALGLKLGNVLSVSDGDFSQRPAPYQEMKSHVDSSRTRRSKRASWRSRPPSRSSSPPRRAEQIGKDSAACPAARSVANARHVPHLRCFPLLSLLAVLSSCQERKPEPKAPPSPSLDRAAEQAQRAARELGAKATSLIDSAAESLGQAGQKLRNATADEAQKAADQARETLDDLEKQLAEKTRAGAAQAKQGAKEGTDNLGREIEGLTRKVKDGLDRLSKEAGPAAERTRKEVADGLEQLRDKLARLKERTF